MCTMTATEYKTLTAAITNLVAARKMFTGYDITDIAVTGFTSCQDVSEKVRALFNQHDPCFRGYGCYPVEGGPLLYFPISKAVVNKATKIQATILAKIGEMTDDDLRQPISK